MAGPAAIIRNRIEMIEPAGAELRRQGSRHRRLRPQRPQKRQTTNVVPFAAMTASVLLVLFFLFWISPTSAGESPQTVASATEESAEEDVTTSTDRSTPAAGGRCLTESDLDFSTCDLEHLPSSALISICDRVGLDVEKHVFPLLEGEDIEDMTEEEVLRDLGLAGDDGKEADAEAGDEKGTEEEAAETKKPKKKDRTRSDYVAAARECLLIESEIARMEAEDPDGLAALERSVLAEDPDLLAEVVSDVLARSPDLVAELQVELRKEDPELYEELAEELGEGETFADRPEVLAELVAVMLAEDPELLEKLDEDVARMMAEEDGGRLEDGDDGSDEEGEEGERREEPEL